MKYLKDTTQITIDDNRRNIQIIGGVFLIVSILFMVYLLNHKQSIVCKIKKAGIAQQCVYRSQLFNYLAFDTNLGTLESVQLQYEGQDYSQNDVEPEYAVILKGSLASINLTEQTTLSSSTDNKTENKKRVVEGITSYIKNSTATLYQINYQPSSIMLVGGVIFIVLSLVYLFRMSKKSIIDSQQRTITIITSNGIFKSKKIIQMDEVLDVEYKEILLRYRAIYLIRLIVKGNRQYKLCGYKSLRLSMVERYIQEIKSLING